MKQYVMVVDIDRCIGCRGGCQVACKTEHEIALGDSRSKLYAMGPEGTYPNLSMYFMPVMCQQCANPSCVAVCPTGACYKDSADGVIKINKEMCIGCESCKNTCPYQTIIMNKELRVADKCTLCAERRERGEIPACVKNCSGQALIVGDIGDPGSSVSKALAKAEKEQCYQLQAEGNEPSGLFILRGAKWLEVLPHKYQNKKKEG